ncbi:methyltransferase-like protein 27 [Ciona intestinalis]
MTRKKLDVVYERGFFNFPERIGPAAVRKFYNRNGIDYDNDMEIVTYTAPDVAAQKAASLVSDKQKENFKLLDLGAGTGLSGAALRRAGFLGNIGALDGSAGMLKVAMEKGIYSDSTEHILTSSNPLPYPDGTFDMVVNVGAFGKSMMEPDCLQDVLRVLQPYSYFVATVRMSSNREDYKVRFYDELDRLEAAGLMKICSSEKFLHYRWDEVSDEFKVNLADQYGEVLVLQKLDIK